MQKSKLQFKIQNFKTNLKSFACRRAFCVLVLSFAFCLLSLNKVKAQSNTRSFTISPPSIRFSLKPGDKTEKILKITNHSAEPLEFVADIKDFIVTDKKGTPELLPPETPIENRFAASTWTTVLPDKFIVLPGKTATTTLYLQVPADARPGGRYFSVIFRPTIAGVGIEGSGAAVSSVVGSLVYLTVLGPTKEDARLILFKTPFFSEYGPIKITTEIKNLGDIHISPRGVIEVKNLLGAKSFTTSLGDLNIFPGTSRIYENSWEKKWLFGRYTANLSGYFGQKSNLPLLASISFWVIPYKLLTVFLLAVAIGVIVFLRFRKKQDKEVE